MKTHIPIYRHHPGSKDRPRNLGYAEWRGHREYFPGPYGSHESRAAYQRWLDEKLASQPHVAWSAVTVAILADAYENWATTYYGEVQMYAIRDAIGPLVTLAGWRKVEDFGPRTLLQLRECMVRGEIRDETGMVVWAPNRKWCRNYINRQIDRVRRVFAWGVTQEMVPISTHQALTTIEGLRKGKTTARETKKIKPANPGHVKAAKAVMVPTLRAMVSVQEFTGMRPGNLVTLRLCEIDTSRRVWEYRPPHHKTEHLGDELVILIGPEAQRAMKPYLHKPEEEYIFSPADAAEERFRIRRAARQTPVQPSQEDRRKPRALRRPGTRYTVASYRRAVSYACKKARVPPWHPNQLRHSCGTRARKRFGLEGARSVLRHKHIQVTEIYAEEDLAKARRIAAKVG